MATKRTKCRCNRRTDRQNGRKLGKNTLYGDNRRRRGGGMHDVLHDHQGERKVSSRVKTKWSLSSQSMKVDTSTAATIINEETYKRINEGNQVKNRPQLETAKVKLQTYAGELVKVIGTLNVIVKYEKQEVELQTLVVEGCGPNLLERDWKKLFKMQIAKSNQESPFGELIHKYSEVFEEGLGTFKDSRGP